MESGTRKARRWIAASAAMLSLGVVTAGLAGVAPAEAKSNHHCGSFIVSGGVGEVGDLKCLGESKLYYVGSLPTCGDSGTRIIPAGTRGAPEIILVGTVATTYKGKFAWRYQWNYKRTPNIWVGYRYCKR